VVPIDGSKASENALEYTIKLQQNLLPSANKEIIILNVLPHFHVLSGFERPMKSLKTGKTTSLTDFIQEMNEVIKKEWNDKLSDIKKNMKHQILK